MDPKVKHVLVDGIRTDITDPNPEEQAYSLYKGTALETGIDLFTITTIGNYYSSTAAITNSLKNCPITDESFRMVCGYLLEDSIPYLIIRTNSGELFTTVYGSDSYSSWKPISNDINIASDVSGGNFGYDFHSINATNRYANVNRKSFFSISDSNRSQWKNIPSTMSQTGNIVGYREILWMNSQYILVKVTELCPTHGKQYYDLYKSGTWIGWNTESPD